MSRQLIGSMKGNFHTVKIYSRDTDLESYVARLFDNKTGKAYPDADYFTTERNDAIKTARGMLKRAEAEHATVRNPRKRAPRRKCLLRDHTAAVAPKARKVRKATGARKLRVRKSAAYVNAVMRRNPRKTITTHYVLFAKKGTRGKWQRHGGYATQATAKLDAQILASKGYTVECRKI